MTIDSHQVSLKINRLITVKVLQNVEVHKQFIMQITTLLDSTLYSLNKNFPLYDLALQTDV